MSDPEPPSRSAGASAETPPAPSPPAKSAGFGGEDAAPTDSRVLMLAAKPGERLFRVLEDPEPLRPLLAALAVVPAVLATPECRLDQVDPTWGVRCLQAYDGGGIAESGPAAWATGGLLALSGTEGAVAYFAVSWAGATLLVWGMWQLLAVAAGSRPAAFAALLTATNPMTAAAAASAPPTVMGVALSVIAAWLWVRAATDGSRTTAAVGGAAGGAGMLLAGPYAGLLPAVVAAADLSLTTVLPAAEETRRRNRWPATFVRAALFATGFLLFGIPAAVAEPSAAWNVDRLGDQGPALLAGLALAGAMAAAGGQLWVAPAARRVTLGLALAASIWFAITGGDGPDAGRLGALVAAVTAAAVALEGACRPAVSSRLIATLAALPTLALIGQWAWTESVAVTAWRCAFAALAAVSLWGVWEVVAFRWSREIRGRRLLIAAVLLLAFTGLRRSVQNTEPTAGRGARQLVAAVAERPETDVVVLAEPDDQQAARFLFKAAGPHRRIFVLDPDGPRVADLLNEALSEEPGPLVAVVGGGPAARLNALRPAGAAPPAPAGRLRGGDGEEKEVRLLVLPSRRRAEN